MGLFDSIKGEFIEVIDYNQNDKNILVYKYPITTKQQIKNGAQLIVGPSQIAIFVYEGEIADIYPSGKYTLTTDTMPVLTSFKNFKYAFNSPFKTDVYFINTSQYINQKWGTSKPITMRDQDFGIVRVRGFGNYSFKIKEYENFLKGVIGAGSTTTLESLSEHLKSIIISTFSDILSSSKIPVIDLPMSFDDLNDKTKLSLNNKFENLSLELTNFAIENVSLPKEVEEAIDKRSSMGALGDLGKYTQYQMADSIKDIAQNEGGLAGLGASVSVGAQMGNIMANAFGGNQNTQQQTNPQNQTKACPNCNTQVDVNSKFCANCGSSMNRLCIACNQPIESNSKFCPHCGSNQSTVKVCDCGHEINSSSKFCDNCGKQVN